MSHEATMWAVKVRKISCAEARVLWHLADCHNPVFGCYPKQDYLADACELDVRSVRRCLDGLREKKLINWVEQRAGKNRLANRYSLAFEAGFKAFDKTETAENEPDNMSGSKEDTTGQNEQLQPDKFDSLNRTPESSIKEPVIEPVIETGNSREGEREAQEATIIENPKLRRDRIEREFKRWFPTWETYVYDSEPAARKAWEALSDDERQVAFDRTAEYLTAAKANGRTKFCSAAVYLSEKRWDRLPVKNAVGQSGPVLVQPFSKPWMAERLIQLRNKAAVLPPPAPMVRRMIDAGTLDPATERAERLAKHGWPKVTTMHDKAERTQGVYVEPTTVDLSASFQRVEAGSELAKAWEAIHQLRGWPWMPGTFPWLYFPLCEGMDVETALTSFWSMIEKEKGNEHAA
jgi:pyocin large subunit-like protein